MTFQFRPDQVAALNAKLDGASVKTRDQGGKTLSYIEGWKVIEEANRIFGFDGWDRETVSITHLATTERKVGKAQKDGWGVGYMAKVRVTIGDIVREGTGCGSGIDADLVSAHESAVKEAETDAMKRALMTFGNPFGLALYDKTQENVEYAPDANQAENDAQYVASAEAWIRAQTDIGLINKTWSGEYERFTTLSVDLQKRLTVVRDETLAALTAKPTASSVDAREVWANKQIIAFGRVASVASIDKFLAANAGAIDALEPYQRKPFDKAVADARRRLTGISVPATGDAISSMRMGRDTPIDLDDSIPF